MVRIFCTELRKMFGSFHIYLCMVILGIIYILAYFGTLSSKHYIMGMTNSYAVISQGSEVMLVAFLLSVVGGSFLYCAEEKHSYFFFEIQRIGTSGYTAGKILTSVFGGFITYIAGSMIFIGGICLHRFWLYGTIVVEKAEFLVWVCVFSALRCGVLSAMGFLVSTFVENYYIAMTAPLLIYYAVLQLEYWVSVFLPQLPSSLFFSSIYMAGLTEGGGWKEFILAFLYTACICLIMYGISKRSIERRLEHA